MNRRQLEKLGVPNDCMREAMTAVQAAAAGGKLRGVPLKNAVLATVAAPQDHVDDAWFGGLAKAIVESRREPDFADIDYPTWGDEIDAEAHRQMKQACRVPSARGAALMPDAHVGYGLPIGGVLALENAVIPFAVGVDIACRMKLSVLDSAPQEMETRFEQHRQALEKGTRFGVGARHEKPKQHGVLDEDWSVTRITRENRDRAWKQLGTSGSGNHFVEFGVLTLEQPCPDLNLEAGVYAALLSHSGSRGTGAAVCDTYSAIARATLPKRYESLGRLAWLSLDDEAGQEYWLAMNLMGRYAAANHEVIHREVTSLLGASIIAGVENHHNFAWKEVHGGREWIVHRKGATPAGEGVLGVIPGSMGSPAFVVRGKGCPASLHSASHGAGRRMSRRAAKDKYNFQAVKQDLAKRGVQVLSAGADEVPGVYKDIHEVMRQQQDLVNAIARFDPKIVKMCGDGSRAED